jgi:hypothetical protein
MERMFVYGLYDRKRDRERERGGETERGGSEMKRRK